MENMFDSITQAESAADNQLSLNVLIGAKRLRVEHPELDTIASDMELIAMMFALLNRRLKAINALADMSEMIAEASCD
jgi:hypothetical protein